MYFFCPAVSWMNMPILLASKASFVKWEVNVTLSVSLQPNTLLQFLLRMASNKPWYFLDHLMKKIIKMARPLNLFWKKLDSLKLACIEYVSSLRDDVGAWRRYARKFSRSFQCSLLALATFCAPAFLVLFWPEGLKADFRNVLKKTYPTF